MAAEKKAPPPVAEKKAPPPVAAKQPSGKDTRVQTTGMDMGAEAQNRMAFLQGLKKGPSASTAATTAAPADAATAPVPKPAPAPAAASAAASDMTFSFSFSGSAAPVPKPEPQAIAPVAKAVQPPIDDEGAERRARAQRLQEEAARMQREMDDAPAAPVDVPVAKQPISPLITFSEGSAVGKLAARVRATRHVALALLCGERAENERDVFLSKYVPLLRTLCQPAGVQLTVTLVDDELMQRVHGPAALEAALGVVDGADMLVGILGRALGTTVDDDVLQEVRACTS